MKYLTKKITAALSGAVLAFSAAGVFPFSAGMTVLGTETMPDVSTMQLLGESTLTDGEFAPIEIFGTDVDSYDTFYVTANQSSAAQSITICCTQEGFIPELGDFVELMKAECSGVVALSDAAYQVKPEHPDNFFKASFMKFSVKVEVTAPFDASIFPEHVLLPENDTLTVKLYGTCEDPDVIPAEKTKLLSQAEFMTKAAPEISMVTDGYFRYVDLSIDGGKAFDPAGTKTLFGKKVYAFSYQKASPGTEDVPAVSALSMNVSDTASEIEPQWKDGSFSYLIDRSSDKKPIPRFAELSCMCVPENKNDEPISGMFRMKLNGCAVVDDAYDTFRIYVRNATQDNVVVRICVLETKQIQGVTVSTTHFSEYIVNTTPTTEFGARVESSGMLELSAKELNAPVGSVIMAESAQCLKDDGSLTAMFGSAEIEGVKDLMNKLQSTEPADQKPLPGDVDCSGDVDVSDAVLLARYVAEDSTAKVTADGKVSADCNKDSFVDLTDVTIILQYIAKVIPEIGA